MQDVDPIDINFLINSNEVKKDANKVKESIKGVGKTAAEVANGVEDQLEKAFGNSGKAADALGGRVGRAKGQFNGLSNSINQVTRELPAFSNSAQTGFLAISNNLPILFDQIANLKAQNQALTASGQKSIPVWRQVISSLFSWQTLLSLGVTLLTVYGGKFFSFISNITKSKDAIDTHKASVEAMNKAYESTSFKNVLQDLLTLRSYVELAKKGLIDKEVALAKYNNTLGKSYKTTNDLNEVEQILIEKAPAYIQSMLYKAAATAATAQAAKDLAENQRKQFEVQEEIETQRKRLEARRNERPRVAGTDFAMNIEANSAQLRNQMLKEELDDLEKDGKEVQKKGAKIVENLNNEAAKIAKAAGLDIFGNNKPENNKRLLNQRKPLLEKIAALDNEYARKQLTRDEEELQALRDKFNKARKLIEEFNSNPKNAKVKIDLSPLDAIQKNAEQDLIYKQQTRALEIEIKEQKRIFEEFEEYKKSFGLTAAQETFKEQLKGYETYLDYLKKITADNKDAFTAVSAGSATGGETERVNLLKKASEDERRIQIKKFNDLLADLMSYEEKRNLLIERYNQQRKLLIESGNVDEAIQLRNQFNTTLKSLDDEYAKSTQQYKDLIRGVENLSEAAARAVITSGRKMIEALQAAGRISEDLARDIIQKIDALEQEVEGRSAEKIGDIANQINVVAGAFLNLGDALESFDEGLADTVTTIGELGQVAGDAAIGIAKITSGKDVVGGIASVINGIAGLFRIGAKARESARRAQQELIRRQQEAEDGERRLNELIRQRNIARAQEVDLTLKGIQAQREALKLAQAQNKADQDALFAELQRGRFITRSRKKKYGGFLGIGRKTKVVNDYASLLGLTFEEIEKLYETGKLEKRTAALFEQLKRLREEGADINNLLGDLEQQAREVFTGTTSEAISDSIIEGLRQGYDSFQDFATDVEMLLQNAILNAIKYQTLEEPIKRLYEEFAKYAESDGELTAAEAEAIRAQYQAQIEEAIRQYEQWSEILNDDLLSGAGLQRGLQGAIRRELTEETASELTGLFRGQFDITKRQLDVQINIKELEKRNNQALSNIMTAAFNIERNTADTVTWLQNAVGELRNIVKNTKPSQSGRDIGKG
jgi:hypothetical protein